MRTVGIITLFILLSPAIGTGDAPFATSANGTPTATTPKSDPSIENRESTAGNSPDHELFVEIIATAYELLEAYAVGPTTSLAFTLSDFETMPRERFDEILYRNLATLPEGRVIDVSRSRVKTPGTEVRHARFIPRWSTHEQSIADLPEGAKMLTLTVAEAVDEIAAAAPEIGGDPSFADVYAFTRYRVVVNLNGEQREYVAAFLWFDSSESSGADLRNLKVFDHITQGVGLAAVETLPTLAQAQVLRESEAQGSGLEGEARSSRSGADDLPQQSGAPSSATTQCIETMINYPQTLGASGTHGHLIGEHFSDAGLRSRCRCDSTCYNECVPQFTVGPVCDDVGLTSNACHVVAIGQDHDGSSTANGTMDAPNCGFAVGCVYRPCFLCSCNLSISAEVTALIASVTVSYDPSGDPLESMNADWEHECALCIEDTPGNPSDPPNQDPCPIDCCDESSCTPIVIDLLGDGFRFSSGPGGVDFDILWQDHPIRVAWTVAGADDLFLVEDYNGDGVISHGGELFGDKTAQPETEEPNGYNALSQYDTQAFFGNEDGKIDAEDGIYPNLWVWHDRDHDGISTWDELYTLEQAGIDAIYLDYWRSKERDRHGNELRYFGRVCLSPREGTLASRLIAQASPGESERPGGYVLDPMRQRLDADPSALARTECEGRIVQATDVFFVD